ncbi:uncharacterized protein PSFLO_02207 [Pseudozyma flocculosa]|uniref:Uncharacterized protein n=1 Tax=Pseudozyma flocculosa TaxID=84751 RepID=A0A5C3EYK9_9BASI|nr:uncharacterized protein PSFLO_02207 [Pseudozyma flocculosa]
MTHRRLLYDVRIVALYAGSPVGAPFRKASFWCRCVRSSDPGVIPDIPYETKISIAFSEADVQAVLDWTMPWRDPNDVSGRAVVNAIKAHIEVLAPHLATVEDEVTKEDLIAAMIAAGCRLSTPYTLIPRIALVFETDRIALGRNERVATHRSLVPVYQRLARVFRGVYLAEGTRLIDNTLRIQNRVTFAIRVHTSRINDDVRAVFEEVAMRPDIQTRSDLLDFLFRTVRAQDVIVPPPPYPAIYYGSDGELLLYIKGVDDHPHQKHSFRSGDADLLNKALLSFQRLLAEHSDTWHEDGGAGLLVAWKKAIEDAARDKYGEVGRNVKAPSANPGTAFEFSAKATVYRWTTRFSEEDIRATRLPDINRYDERYAGRPSALTVYDVLAAPKVATSLDMPLTVRGDDVISYIKRPNGPLPAGLEQLEVYRDLLAVGPMEAIFANISGTISAIGPAIDLGACYEVQDGATVRKRHEADNISIVPNWLNMAKLTHSAATARLCLLAIHLNRQEGFRPLLDFIDKLMWLLYPLDVFSSTGAFSSGNNSDSIAVLQTIAAYVDGTTAQLPAEAETLLRTTPPRHEMQPAAFAALAGVNSEHAALLVDDGDEPQDARPEAADAASALSSAELAEIFERDAQNRVQPCQAYGQLDFPALFEGLPWAVDEALALCLRLYITFITECDFTACIVIGVLVPDWVRVGGKPYPELAILVVIKRLLAAGLLCQRPPPPMTTSTSSVKVPGAIG